MTRVILKNGVIVTGEKCGTGTVVIQGDRIVSVMFDDEAASRNGYVNNPAKSETAISNVSETQDIETIETDLSGKLLFAGGIDAHVHFREPGLIHKGDMQSEARAAVAGGVTSFIDMPNTDPATTSLHYIEAKAARAQGRVCANYAFHLGATNENINELKTAVADSPESFSSIKVFMGSSTGNMLVDNDSTLQEIFAIKGKRVLVHCEDEATIRANLQSAKAEYDENIPFGCHPQIRSREACVLSTCKAIETAIEHNTQLHILHVSTADEINMIARAKAINPNITAETSINYLWFCDDEYAKKGAKIKCNPAIKTADDRAALRQALKNGDIDTIGSDHAPHTLQEKAGNYLASPSGIPSIQQTLLILLTIAKQENIPLKRIAQVFSEKTAEILCIHDRGKIKEGYFADLVIVDPSKPHIITREEQVSKCGWTPYESEEVVATIDTVYVNGQTVYVNGQKTNDFAPNGRRLVFTR